MNKRYLLPCACAFAICMISILSGCNSPAVIPTTFETFNAPDGSFAVTYPTEWQAEDGGKGDFLWAKFASGSAFISIETDVAGSVMGDIAKSHVNLIGMKDSGQDESPVAKVHETERESFEADNGVKEQTPSMPIVTKLGEGRKAEFVGSKTFGGLIHGYRATVLTTSRRITIVCQCSENEWESLKPSFDKVIESLSRGKTH
jgi:hypothetical protein